MTLKTLSGPVLAYSIPEKGLRLSSLPRTSGIAVLLAGLLQLAEAQVCAPVAIPNHYGPFDYNVDRQGRLEIVERFHFTPSVEGLLRGASGHLGGDLSYTLNAFPNHHRALAAIMRWGISTKNPQPPQLRFSIDCYFDRATRFRPKDTIVRSLFAMYLAQTNRKPQALEQLRVAREAASESAVSLNSIGLVYVEMKEFELAREAARAAAALGFQDSPLIGRLRSLKEWDDAAEAAKQEAANNEAASSASSSAVGR